MWTKSFISFRILCHYSPLSKNSVTGINWTSGRTLFNKAKESPPKPPPEGDRFDRMTFDEDRHKEVIEASRMFSRDDKNRESFLAIVDSFGKHTQYRSRLGQCEFIYGAMKSLKEYGLHKDLEAYKKLMNVMPKEKMVPKNYFAEMSVFYAKHQATAVRLLDYMEQNGVVPDREMQDLIISIFGERSMVWRKMARMNYWMSKFKNASPFPLPEKMSTDSLEISKLLLKRICPDLQTKIQCYRTKIVPDSLDDTWIVTAQSLAQKEIIANLDEPLFVEGPFNVMLRGNRLNYFMLKTAPPKKFCQPEEDTDPFDVSNLKMNFFGYDRNDAIAKTHSLHQQIDGTIIALCCTGTSSRDSLLSWIRILEQLDANLKKLQIIFKLKAPPKFDLVEVDKKAQTDDQKTETEPRTTTNKCVDK